LEKLASPRALSRRAFFGALGAASGALAFEPVEAPPLRAVLLPPRPPERSYFFFSESEDPWQYPLAMGLILSTFYLSGAIARRAVP